MEKIEIVKDEIVANPDLRKIVCVKLSKIL